MDYVKRIFYINLYTKELKLFNFKDLFLSMYSDANQDVLNIRKKYSKSVLSMVNPTEYYWSAYFRIDFSLFGVSDD